MAAPCMSEVGDTESPIAQMRQPGLRAGLALNPDTHTVRSSRTLPGDSIDLILCMTVFPGFGGQSFMADVLDKVRHVRSAVRAGSLPVDIEVDGGIDAATTALLGRPARVRNVFVAGSAVFGHERPWEVGRRDQRVDHHVARMTPLTHWRDVLA